ncbi:hypothetical protein Tco_0830506 [Tanacetum coccineum]
MSTKIHSIMSSDPNYEWEQLFDIDDSDLLLTHVLRPCNSHVLEEKPVRIIPGPAGIVQAAKLLKQRDIVLGWDRAVMSTQEYMKKVVEDVGGDEDFKSGAWLSATEYVNANSGIVSGCLIDIKNFLKNGKLEQVVAIIKSCTLNALGDLTVIVKDLSGTIAGAIHHKVINEGGYGKDITLRFSIRIQDKKFKSFSSQCLGKDICQLIFCSDKHKEMTLLLSQYGGILLNPKP